MKVRVRVPNQLRDLVAGAAVIEVNVAAGSAGATTVAAVLDALAGTHPSLERRVRDELGRTRPHVNLFVGSDNVRDCDGLATPIGANGEVTILPAVSGGCAPFQAGATRSALAGTRSSAGRRGRAGEWPTGGAP